MVRCLIGAKFTMKATLLHQDSDFVGDTDPTLSGEWVDSQDPLTGQIVRVWHPTTIPDDPTTPVLDPQTTIPCVARGFSTTNRYTSNQVFGDDYKNIDSIRMWVPAWVRVTKNDRLTNIRDTEDNILWIEDYVNNTDEIFQAATFNVSGVTPQLGPFNKHIDTLLILERVEVANV